MEEKNTQLTTSLPGLEGTGMVAKTEDEIIIAEQDELMKSIANLQYTIHNLVQIENWMRSQITKKL